MGNQLSCYSQTRTAWEDEHASGLPPLQALVYRSNTLGVDSRLTGAGGGSTSVKTMVQDPATDELVEVIWVKRSGAELGSSSENHFSPLYQHKLMALQSRCECRPLPEAEVRQNIRQASLHQGKVVPSIDTPLHAFMPYAHVSHTHATALLAIGACKNSRAITEKLWGREVLWLPRQAPGLRLGTQLRCAWNNHPDAKGALLAGNGVAAWSDDNKACYQQTLKMMEQAEQYIRSRPKKAPVFGPPRFTPLTPSAQRSLLATVLPHLRQWVSDRKPLVATVESGHTIQAFVNAADGQALANRGAACAYHLLRTKHKPLYIPWNPQGESVDALIDQLRQGVERYRRAYQTYYEAHYTGHSRPMRSSAPSVCLIPGLGLIAWGQSKQASREAAQSYLNTVEVIRDAQTLGRYQGLSDREAFAIDYGGV